MMPARKPALRFAGFDEEWERRGLGELADFNPKAELPEVFEYVDLESVVGTEMIAHREETRATAPSRAQRLAQVGDIFYQTVRPYQKNNYFFENTDATYVFSTGYAQMRPRIDGRFLLSYVQTDQLVNAVLDRCTGTSYPAINSNDLAEMNVCVPPSRQEQHEIGSFFRHLDRLIALHRRKTARLGAIKKAMLEKMFPQNGATVPQIRFAGFTAPWEQRKLGELGTLKNGMNFSKEAMGHGFAFVNLQNIFGHNVVDVKNLGLAEASEKQLTEYSLQKGDVLFVRSSVKLEGVGETALVPENLENTTYSGFVIRFRDEFGLNYDFKKIIFSTKKVRDQIMSQATNSANKNVSQTVLENLELEIPSFDEQAKIGSFFRHLDRLLTLHQRRLERLQNIKKACLEKMFV